MADEHPTSREELEKLRVVDLKEKLSELGLQIYGRKADLVGRLWQYYETMELEKQQLTEREEKYEDEDTEEEGSNDDDEEDQDEYQQDMQEMERSQSMNTGFGLQAESRHHLMQQEKEAMGMHQAAMLEQQQRESDMMHKAIQQQKLIEEEKRQQMQQIAPPTQHQMPQFGMQSPNQQQMLARPSTGQPMPQMLPFQPSSDDLLPNPPNTGHLTPGSMAPSQVDQFRPQMPPIGQMSGPPPNMSHMQGPPPNQRGPPPMGISSGQPLPPGSMSIPPPGSISIHPPGTMPGPPPGSMSIHPPGTMPGPPPGSMSIPPPGSMSIPPPGSMSIPPPGSMSIPPPGSMSIHPPGTMPGPPPGSMSIHPPGTMPGPPPGSMPGPSPGSMSVPPPPPGSMSGPPPGQLPMRVPPPPAPPISVAPPQIRVPPPPGVPSMPQSSQMSGPPPRTMGGSLPPRSIGPPPGHMGAPPPSIRQQPPPPHIRGPPPPPGSAPIDLNQAPPSEEIRPLMSLETRPLQEMEEDEEEPEIKLPSALDKVLAFKFERAQQLGIDPAEIDQIPEQVVEEQDDDEIPYDDDDEEEEEEEVVIEKPSSKTKESKNKKRKKKKKRAKQRKLEQKTQAVETNDFVPAEEENVEIEYVQEQLALSPNDPLYHQFARIFENFMITEPPKRKEAVPEVPKEETKKEEITKGKHLMDLVDMAEDDDDDDEGSDDKPKLSKKKLKKMNRLSVAELKQLVTRPDVVEMHDVTAQDPKLLVALKAARNTVPVPRHWCFKRKYLQGKRGIEKPAFELPDYIKATGVMEMREALQEKEDQKSMKQKMREKVRPKMGKIDIDYQKLHDAFFRWQTKPKMTIHGDLYYEGKEFETRLKEKKPGNLSDDLRTALGMPIGSNAEKIPPPWLIAMQRYGPPPSYPNLKIPGLNGPIPEACSFGYHAGGWGKPPVDETGKPLYGDVFGPITQDIQAPVEEEEFDKTQWGDMESESESEEESEEEEEEEEEEPDKSGLITPADGGITPSGLSSIPAGMETPDMIELRKKKIEDMMEGGETPQLYQVLPEKKTAVGAAMMGSAHGYDVSGVGVPPNVSRKDRLTTEGIEVALNPEELDLDSAAMQAKYEETLKEQQSQLEKEDLSDMVAEHAAKQTKKRKKQQQESGKAAKKYKEFKF